MRPRRAAELDAIVHTKGRWPMGNPCGFFDGVSRVWVRSLKMEQVKPATLEKYYQKNCRKVAKVQSPFSNYFVP